MLLDLHTHTTRYSRCSILNPGDLVVRAKAIGLDGLAITEHDHLWSPQELSRLQEDAGVEDLVLLRGKEIEREWRHLLIFNYPHEIRRQATTKEVIDEVHHEGGVVILAHPFRYGRLLDLALDDLKDLLAAFDAVEVLTPQHSDQENQRALVIQEDLHLTGTGASDSHDTDQVGRYVTYFPTPIRDEEGLAQGIREGRCSPLFGYQCLKGLAAELRADRAI